MITRIKKKSRFVASIDADICSGCEVCIAVMPKEICIEKIDFESDVPFSLVPVDVHEDKCTGCTMCLQICPWEAIKMIPRVE